MKNFEELQRSSEEEKALLLDASFMQNYREAKVDIRCVSHDVREIEYFVFENRDFSLCNYHEYHKFCN
ncbi:hypothetical protein [Candidatus Electronema sp. JM]|uniref:hypothetical protein n=1 Tax=Candidatus Electronema sp. JM TaxID=3401571 RepID=UPI003AA9503E